MNPAFRDRLQNRLQDAYARSRIVQPGTEDRAARIHRQDDWLIAGRVERGGQLEVDRQYSRFDEHAAGDDGSRRSGEGGIADLNGDRGSGHTVDAGQAQPDHTRHLASALHLYRADGERLTSVHTIGHVPCIRPATRTAGVIENIGPRRHQSDESLDLRTLIVDNHREE